MLITTPASLGPYIVMVHMGGWGDGGCHAVVWGLGGGGGVAGQGHLPGSGWRRCPYNTENSIIAKWLSSGVFTSWQERGHVGLYKKLLSQTSQNIFDSGVL